MFFLSFKWIIRISLVCRKKRQTRHFSTTEAPLWINEYCCRMANTEEKKTLDFLLPLKLKMALNSKPEQQLKKIWLIQAMRQHRILIGAIYMSFSSHWISTNGQQHESMRRTIKMYSRAQCQMLNVLYKFPFHSWRARFIFCVSKFKKHHRSRTLFWFDYVNFLCYFIEISSFKLVISIYIYIYVPYIQHTYCLFTFEKRSFKNENSTVILTICRFDQKSICIFEFTSKISMGVFKWSFW